MRCAERLSFVSILWYERLLRIVSLSSYVKGPNSEVKKLINVCTWTTGISPVNVLCISLYLSLPVFLHNVCDWYGYTTLEHSLWINTFRPIWSCHIIKVLATWAKFLEPSDYNTVFCHFRYIKAEFKLVKHKFSNQTTFTFKSHTCEAIHNVSVHELPLYYHPQQVPTIVWTASILPSRLGL